MMSVTRRTELTISPMVVPAFCTRAAPDSTFSTDTPISVLISLAAWAERWASERTSLATTAKPRPCSPARAASTAALRARILVWNAMPSMVPMMSAIFLLLVLISSMVVTTCATTSPPRWATCAADTASWLACTAESALWRTVLVSSSIELAVSCRLLAVCSVRALRSWLPMAIWVLAVEMLSTTPRTCCSERCRALRMASRARSKWPVSSLA
ncbi:hypothetical protein D3C71_895270 [compost metagenome]